MPINKGEEFLTRDIYIEHPFEKVMFRWNHVERRIYRKFYGRKESNIPIDHTNKLFNDALLYGHEVSEEGYQKCNDG